MGDFKKYDMSDFVRTKGIVYPISREAYEKIDDLLSSAFKDSYAFWNDDGKGFNTDCFDSDELRYYLVYVLFHSYGEENGGFGSGRSLTDAEKKYWTDKFRPVLEGAGEDVDPDKFKYIDWCYYNACESDDYYVSNGLDVDTILMDKYYD